MKVSKIFKKIIWGWIKFWGKRFWIYKDNKEINEILIYNHKIYVLGGNNNLKKQKSEVML